MPGSNPCQTPTKWILPKVPLDYLVFDNEDFLACPEAVYHLSAGILDDTDDEMFDTSCAGKSPFLCQHVILDRLITKH